MNASGGPPEGPTGIQSNPYEVDMEPWTWISVNHRNDCDALFDEFKQGNQELADLNNLDYLKDVNSYRENVKAVFVNSSLNYNALINYHQSNNKIQDAKELFTPRIEIVELNWEPML